MWMVWESSAAVATARRNVDFPDAFDPVSSTPRLTEREFFTGFSKNGWYSSSTRKETSGLSS